MFDSLQYAAVRERALLPEFRQGYLTSGWYLGSIDAPDYIPGGGMRAGRYVDVCQFILPRAAFVADRCEFVDEAVEQFGEPLQ